MPRDSTPQGPSAAALLQQQRVSVAPGSATPTMTPRVWSASAAAQMIGYPALGKSAGGFEEDLTDLVSMTAAIRSNQRRQGGSEVARRSNLDVILPGCRVGNYRIVELLANGGMGTVYLGEHIHLNRKVALKFLHQHLLDDSWAVSRFFGEAIAAIRIGHPGAVSVFDYGPFEEGAYLVMEYLRGETLKALLKREGRLPVERILDLGVQIALTLDAAHRAGVIHRDLKPSNIHLVSDPTSGRELVKVLDFGVAKLAQPAEGAPLTKRGDLLGTPYYMAPEQTVNAGTVDERCDVYSLGCLLYQLVTGNMPFRGSIFAILVAHQTEVPVPPRNLVPTVPPALDALILRMMSKAPQERPGSMAEVADALASISRARSPQPGRAVRWLGFAVGGTLFVAGLTYLISLL